MYRRPDASTTAPTAAAGVVGGPVAGAVNSAVSGVYGVLRMGADGTWTYILDNGDKETQALKFGDVAHDVFTYAATDAQSSPRGRSCRYTCC